MLPPAIDPVLAPEYVCPHCGVVGGMLTLLTSMTRYFRCAHCQRSWQLIRPDIALPDESVA